MDIPINELKRAFLEGRPQIGLWSSLASHITVEVIAGSGFDWLLLDTEHSPNELTMVQSQLQAMTGGTATAVVRPAWNDPVLFKRLLDIGVQSFLVPWVQTVEEAQTAVASTRYPPEGIRGFAAITRANRYGRIKDYARHVHNQLCVVVQIETRVALQNLEAIARVDGIDGLFIGPSDLAADLGHFGNSAHPDVRATIDGTITRIVKTGKVAGILAPVEADARHWLQLGCRFVAVGSDAGILARQSEALAAKFKQQALGET
ncbi:MAG: HpcH/HpaI aldolase/citrate lyase family protein [Acidobacteria bacterium]|nr:HpcH/HpaI aldolase/citrate lyase family protein [Acidobacteriota bacterium]MCA1649067.1 HpcH/HpaI aldolase/citrate lyase family protein [Acidobacteriota bacterium]